MATTDQTYSNIHRFQINGVDIKTPDGYKPVFATTSTEDSDRTQDLIMHNTPMGTIEGYDLTWNNLTSAEIANILNLTMNKSSFSFNYRDPMNASGWSVAEFYASNFNMQAQRLGDRTGELWSGLTINVRSKYPVNRGIGS